MKKKGIIERFKINSKLSYFLIVLVCALTFSLVVGTTYSLKSSQLSINGDESVDVGDVVTLRRYILDGNGKYKVTINAEHASFFSPTGFKTNFEILSGEDSQARNGDISFNIIPDFGYEYVKSYCDNTDEIIQKSPGIWIQGPITSDLNCTVIYGKYEPDIIENTNTGLVDLEQSVLTNSYVLSNQKINITGYFDHKIKSYNISNDSSCSNTFSDIDKATITAQVSSNGKYYLCTKDYDNKVYYTSFEINNYDTKGPEIVDIVSKQEGNYYHYKAKITDELSGIKYSAVTATDDDSTISWDTYYDAKYEDIFETNMSQVGHYYLWFKDSAGNVSKKDVFVSELSGEYTAFFFANCYRDQGYDMAVSKQIRTTDESCTSQNQTYYYGTDYPVTEVTNLEVDNGTATYEIFDDYIIKINFTGGTLQQSDGPIRKMEYSPIVSKEIPVDVISNNDGSISYYTSCPKGDLNYDESYCMVCEPEYYYDEYYSEDECFKITTVNEAYYYYINNLTYKYKTTYDDYMRSR